jgi:hypothetical protein
MKKVFESIVTALLIIILQMLISGLGGLLLGPKISVMLFSSTDGDTGKYIESIDFYNYDNKLANDIWLGIPKSVDTTAITSTRPISITAAKDEVPSLSTYKRINISSLSPNSLTRVFFPVKDKADFAFFKIENIREKRITFLSSENLESPAIKAIKDDLFALVINLISYSILFYFLLRWLDNKLGRYKKEISIIDKSLDEAKEKQIRYGSAVKKIQRILIKKNAEITRELDYWKDTIRKILYEQKKDPASSDKLIRIIAESLKSYSHSDSNKDQIELAETMASMMLSEKKIE